MNWDVEGTTERVTKLSVTTVLLQCLKDKKVDVNRRLSPVIETRYPLKGDSENDYVQFKEAEKKCKRTYVVVMAEEMEHADLGIWDHGIGGRGDKGRRLNAAYPTLLANHKDVPPQAHKKAG